MADRQLVWLLLGEPHDTIIGVYKTDALAARALGKLNEAYVGVALPGDDLVLSGKIFSGFNVKSAYVRTEL